jgi:hypothetical protein
VTDLDAHPLVPQTETPGAMLARLRQGHRPELTQKALADRIHFGRSTVTSAESGKLVPGRKFWSSADRVLAAGGRLVAAYDRAQAQAAAAKATVAAAAMLTDRAAVARSHAAMLAMDSVPESVVEALEAEALHAALRYATAAPGVLLRELEATRTFAITALDRTRRPAAAARLMRVLAQTSGLAATTAFDLGRSDAAADYAAAAWQYADLADDPDIRAWARSAQATVAFWEGNPASGLRWAEDGLRCARGHGAARLHAIAARAHALLGDADAARAAIAAAHSVIDDEAPLLAGELRFGRSRLALCSAAVHVALGEGPAAAAYARDALDAHAAETARTRRFAVAAAAQMELAAAHLLQDEPDAVAPTIAPALAIAPEQRTLRLARRVAGLDRRLATAPSSSTPTVRELRARIAHFHGESLPALAADEAPP